MSELNGEANILLVIHSLKNGGAETMVEYLARGLMELGYSVVVLSLHNTKSDITERMSEEGISLLTLDKQKGLDLRVPLRIAKIIKDYRIDIVHSHLMILHYVAPAVRMCDNVKLFHTLHSIAVNETSNKYARKLNRFFYQHAWASPIALSKETAKTVEEEYGFEQGTVPWVLNGIDLNRFSCNRSNELHSPVRILHVGRFVPLKRHDLCIKTLSELTSKGYSCELMLVGEGETRQATAALAERCGVSRQVSFVGLSSRVDELMSGADIFLLPSDHEGVPMVLAEALASGLPVVTRSVGGIPSMIDDGDSGLLADGDPSSLASAIASLIDDNGLRFRIQQQAVEAASQFDYRQMSRHYAELYER